jgi:SAM-dependent methyltransferase
LSSPANPSATFYDRFVPYQRGTGINDRIYGLYRRMKKLGLKSDSRILELGCGIGALTCLLSRAARNGKVESVDLSPASVEAARRNAPGANVVFAAADVVGYRPSSGPFDFITLFDVVEHIPVERHADLFRGLAGLMQENTRLLLNLPNPDSIEFDRRHDPGRLQEIDQPIGLRDLLPHFESNGLDLLSYGKYSIWARHDYIFYALGRKTAYTGKASPRHFGQRVFLKLHRLWLRGLSRRLLR